VGSAGVRPGNSVAFLLGLRQSLSMIGEARPVLFVDQVPELGLDPGPCGARPLRIPPARAPQCSVALAEVQARQSQYRALVDAALKDFPQVLRFDPVPLFCRQRVCSAIDEGRVIYRDDDHLNGNGAIKLARSLLDALHLAGATPKAGGGT
jgi:hypothetical protein